MVIIILCSVIVGLILGILITPLTIDFRKIEEGKKPFGWWCYWLLCEAGWFLRNSTNYGWSIYYKYLNKMCDKYKITLYGRKLN